jgi:hypothetical protein
LELELLEKFGLSSKNEFFEKKILLKNVCKVFIKSKKIKFFQNFSKFSYFETVLVNQKTERLLFNAQNPEKPITSQTLVVWKIFTFLKLQILET